MKIELKRAVERLDFCQAPSLEDMAVVERFGEETIWGGAVSVSLIEGHPQTDKYCAWSSLIEGSKKRQYYAILHIPPIDSPEKAVRASIVHAYKNGKGDG